MGTSDAQSFTPDERRQQREARLRSQGLRPLVIWVPDITSPKFAEEARRQSLLIANSPYEKEDQDFVDSISVVWDEWWDDDWNLGDTP